jgi:hypothetical protein
MPMPPQRGKDEHAQQPIGAHEYRRRIQHGGDRTNATASAASRSAAASTRPT